MSAAYQCPNCGGYKTDAESIMGDETVEIPYINRFTWLNNISLGCLIYIGLVIGMMFIFGHLSYSNGLSIFIFGFPLLFAIVIPIINNNKIKEKAQRGEKRRMNRPVAIGYHYHCTICGNKWTWFKGDPIPQVTVRPNLIAMANQPWTCNICGRKNGGEATRCEVCAQPKPTR
jgi:hypothetical protein